MVNEKPQLTRQMAKELIIKAENQLKTLQAQGLQLKSTSELLKKTKRAYVDKKLNETISNLNQLGSVISKIKKYSTDFSKQLLTCHKGIKQAKLMDMDITSYTNQLEEANNDFDYEHFDEAIEKVRDCNKRLTDNMFLFVSNRIKEIYDQLKDLPTNVLNSQDIQQRFDDVDVAIKDNDFKYAWDLTSELNVISSDILKPYLKKVQEIAKDKIIEFQNDIENARKKDIDISDANEIFTKMVGSMQKASRISEYKEIIDYTTAGKHALERALRRKERMVSQSKDVKEKLDQVFADYKELQNHCAIPTTVETLMKSAKQELSSCKFEAAIENTKKCKQKLEKLRSASEPKIDLKVQSDTLKSDIWNRTKLIVTNKGLASANNITIRFSGPLEVRRLPVIEVLNYSKSKTIEIGLKPEGAGSLPIDVDIDFTRSMDDKEYHDHEEMWLVVTTSQPSSPPISKPTFVPPTTPMDTDRPSRKLKVNCIYCQNPIDESDPIFLCDCGSIYHLDCATNLDICVKCGSDIEGQVQGSPVIE